MKTIAEAASSASAASRPTAGRQLATANKITVETAPPSYEPYVDKLIPEKVWRGWQETDKPRMLVRQLTQNERAVVERRALRLEQALMPDGDHDRKMIALAEMYDSFTSMRQTVDESALARVTAAATLLADFPSWAVEGACLSIRRSGYEVDGRIEQKFAPSDAQIVVEVEKFLAMRRRAAKNARALLEAAVETQVETPSPGTVEELLRDFKAKMGRGPERDEAEERHRRSILAANNKRHIEDLRQQYRAAGLPVPEGETFASLPMMLHSGWTIVRDQTGANVLIAPIR